MMLLTFQDLLRTIAYPLDLRMALLDDILHAHLRLLQIIWQHIPIQLEFPQPLVMLLPRYLDLLVCLLCCLDRRVNRGAT